MQCLCHSGESYASCCAPFHRGNAAPNAQALMRSRYSAYALGNVHYILKTTHPDNPDNQIPLDQRKKQINAFCKATIFEDLEILDFSEEGDIASVTFYAHLSQNGKDVSFVEKSQFVKVRGRWLYLGGKKETPRSRDKNAERGESRICSYCQKKT